MRLQIDSPMRVTTFLSAEVCLEMTRKKSISVTKKRPSDDTKCCCCYVAASLLQLPAAADGGDLRVILSPGGVVNRVPAR